MQKSVNWNRNVTVLEKKARPPDVSMSDFFSDLQQKLLDMDRQWYPYTEWNSQRDCVCNNQGLGHPLGISLLTLSLGWRRKISFYKIKKDMNRDFRYHPYLKKI